MKKFSQIKQFRSYNRINEQNELIPQNAGQIEMSGQSEDRTGISKFFSKILESREMAQVYHWTVKGDMGSHAAHLALEPYYSDIIGLLDELVEVYQGQYELIEDYEIIDTSASKTKDKVEYFTDVVNYIKEARKIVISAEDTHIQNTVDEVISLIYKLLYKLKYNK